jgi:hypothetical protein
MLPSNCCDDFRVLLPECWTHTSRLESLLHTLHEVTTRCLGLEGTDYFRKYYDSSDSEACGSAAPSYSLRLAYYPTQQQDLHDDNIARSKYR